MIIARAAAAALVAVLVLPAVALGHPTSHFIQSRTSIRVHGEYVFGHRVRVCSWRPGDPRVRGLVDYSKALATVPGWAGAARKRSRTVCAINGGTYRTRAPGLYRPSGTVYARGRRITPVQDAPAVGLLAGGRVVFGAAAARRHGSVNIMNGLAYLVWNGRGLRSAPWTTPAQFSCGARGTDGPFGCDRSVLAQFSNGRVGLVEIGHASMRLAAQILLRMRVRTAITFDSGGAALLWTLQGRHNTARNQVGRVFGTAAGTPWHRRIPDAIVINARRVA